MSPGLQALLRWCGRRVGRWAARSYVAGPELKDGIAVCRRLSAAGVPATLCRWKTRDADPRAVANAALAAIGAVVSARLKARVALKAPALGYDSHRLDEIISFARSADVGVHFDAHDIESADRTLALAARAARRLACTGCTLPARWRRSLDDAELAIRLGLRVRLVKGQWPDPEAPDADARQEFLRLVDRVAGRARYVSVATHDAPLAREALRRLALRTPCELELLFGLPMKRAMREAREAGVPVRVYVGYGEGSLPYSIAQAREDPRILLRVARDTILGRHFRLVD